MGGLLRRIIKGKEPDQVALAKESLELQRQGVRLSLKDVRLTWLVVFLTLVALAGSAWAISIALREQAATEVITLRPFAADVPSDEVTGSVTATMEGSCWTEAYNSSRGDSFRCIDETDLIWDPCFAHWRGYQVACVDDPAVPSYMVLTIEEPVDWQYEDRISVYGPNPHFAVRTHSGLLCHLAGGGTRPLLAGVDVHYFCEGEVEAHTLRITSGLWTISIVDEDRGIDRSEVVRQAYR